MTVNRKDLLRTLRSLRDTCYDGCFCRDEREEELEMLSDILGGHDNFVAWKENDIFTYLIGVLDGLELPDNWRIEWEVDHD